MTDQQYMSIAIDLALKGRGQTSPNPMVGAVVVKRGKIISQGWHRQAGGDHAEIVALEKAGARVKGAKLYVTLEPCHHNGRTPPCVDEVIARGIKEVVVGVKDPNPFTNGKSITKLRRNRIKVKSGILERECRALIKDFEKHIVEKLPYVVAKSAQTLDGKIATRTGQSKWITSNQARTYARRLRNDFDAILVGINTVLKDQPLLRPADSRKRLKKVILDSDLKISIGAKLFKGAKLHQCIVATTKKAPKKKVLLLQNLGVDVIICPQTRHGIQLRGLFKQLAKREITSILVEGGAHVVGSALREGLVDAMHIYIAPKMLGDQQALSAVTGVDKLKIDQAIELKNLTVEPIGPDILVKADVYRNR